MSISIDLEWVRDFLAVAERRSFTAATKARGLTQPSLTRRIQSLENWLGVELFDRHRSPLKLTPAGKKFLREATKILDAVRDAREAVSSGAISAIPIYTLETLAATFVPYALGTIRKLLFDTGFEIKTSIITGEIIDCVEAIAFETAPFMIVYENWEHRIMPPRGIPEDRWERVIIADDRLIPVCGSASYGLYQAMLQDEQRLPLSTYTQGRFLDQLVREKLNQLDLTERVHPVDFAATSDTLRNLARENQGIAWVLHSTAQRALKEQEIEIFDFGKGVDTYIDLDIVMFRARDFSSPTIRPSTLNRIWGAAQDLQEQISPVSPPPGPQSSDQ